MKQVSAVFLLFVLAWTSIAQSKSPRMSTVTPDTGKAAADYAVAGENLDTSVVKEVYLTNGKDDIKVQVLTQKADGIQFKVPAGTKAGRYSLMVLTADGKQFIEQPVKLTIE